VTSAFALIALLLLIRQHYAGTGSGTSAQMTLPAIPTTLPALAQKATTDARAKVARARRTGHPADHAAAANATKQATVLTQAVKKAQTQPAPWPQVVPKGLPPFPAGWQPDDPPPQAVQARAVQLLPVLWKSGKPGGTKQEQTQGRWITYQAQKMGTKKGVVAFRVRADAMPEPTVTMPPLA